MAHMRASVWEMERNSVYYQFGRAQKLAILCLTAGPFSFIQNAQAHTQTQTHRTPRILMLLMHAVELPRRCNIAVCGSPSCKSGVHLMNISLAITLFSR